METQSPTLKTAVDALPAERVAIRKSEQPTNVLEAHKVVRAPEAAKPLANRERARKAYCPAGIATFDPGSRHFDLTFDARVPWGAAGEFLNLSRCCRR